ncbi:hypothetical protein [Bosea thiooxidans]
MFGLFEAVAKRVSDQIAEHAAAQSKIVDRMCGEWFAPFQGWQPARAVAKRPSAASRRGPPAKRSRASR